MNTNKVNNKPIWRSKFESLRFGIHSVGVCNICGTHFKPSSRFVRYCDTCREESEIYKHAGWALYS